MNERQLKVLKSAKTLNMVLLVFTAIGVVFSLIGLPTILNPSRETYELLGQQGLEIYETLNTPFYKGYNIISIVLSVLLLVFYIKAHLTMRGEQVPSDFPYFLTIGIQLVGLVIAFLTSPQTFVLTALLTVLYCILPILTLVNLSKVESNK